MDQRVNIELCPCCSQILYAECCGVFHSGNLPPTAVQLMRSRYAAYALNLPDYIIQTTHPKNPQFNSNTQAWRQSLVEFAQTFTFQKLEILDSCEDGLYATVTFKAYLMQQGRDASFAEKSEFIKRHGVWLYKDGKVEGSINHL